MNYAWNKNYFHGQIACQTGDLLAYAIVTPGKREGVVRVAHRTKTELRTLLKGMRGRVKDLAFNNDNNDVCLAAVDEFNDLFVFKVDAANLETSALWLQINSGLSEPCPPSDVHRVVWCPYLPEDDDEDDESASKLLALTHNDVAEMWDVEVIVSEYGRGPHEDKAALTNGRLRISGQHAEAITDAAFSPDGTALATASLDGKVKFFQVYMNKREEEQPRCLHEWSPHGGKAVSSLFFLDDHKNHESDAQFWKYAVTGCDRNAELKIWSCETWSCLQTVRFEPKDDNNELAFKAALDLSGRFLLLSDIHRKNVYVLQIREVRNS